LQGGRAHVGLARGDEACLHANLLTLLRALCAGGASLRLPDRPRLRAALRGVDGAGAIGWITARDDLGSLADVDIVVQRRDPLVADPCDAPVVDAQAAGRVVVAFDGELHAPDLVDHGATGFIARDVGDAVAVVRRLCVDTAARQAIGAAARRAARERDDDQARRSDAFYRGTMR